MLLDTESGYSETFQYLKEFWAAGVLFVVCYRMREWLYAVWGGLLTYLLLDDAVSLHEVIGEGLVAGWSWVPPFGLRLRDLGELMVSFSVGIVFLMFWALSYRRGSAFAKGVSLDLLVLLGLLAFFGIFMDMVSIAAEAHLRGHAIAEDGGEMLAMTLIASYAIHLLEPDRHVPGKLWLWVKNPIVGCFAKITGRHC